MLSNIEKGDTLAISSVQSKANICSPATGGDYKYAIFGGSINYYAGINLTGVNCYVVAG